MILGTGLFIDSGPKRVVLKIVVYQIIAGIGAGPSFQATLVAFQSHLVGKENLLASAIAAVNFLRNLSTTLSVVVGGVILQQDGGVDVKSNLHSSFSSIPPSTLESRGVVLVS